MNAPATDTEPGRHTPAIGVWENEGGAPAPDTRDHQDGWEIVVHRSGRLRGGFPGVETTRVALTPIRRRPEGDNRLSLTKRYASYRADRSGIPAAGFMPIVAACQP